MCARLLLKSAAKKTSEGLSQGVSCSSTHMIGEREVCSDVTVSL